MYMPLPTITTIDLYTNTIDIDNSTQTKCIYTIRVELKHTTTSQFYHLQTIYLWLCFEISIKNLVLLPFKKKYFPQSCKKRNILCSAHHSPQSYCHHDFAVVTKHVHNVKADLSWDSTDSIHIIVSLSTDGVLLTLLSQG